MSNYLFYFSDADVCLLFRCLGRDLDYSTRVLLCANYKYIPKETLATPMSRSFLTFMHSTARRGVHRTMSIPLALRSIAGCFGVSRLFISYSHLDILSIYSFVFFGGGGSLNLRGRHLVSLSFFLCMWPIPLFEY